MSEATSTQTIFPALRYRDATAAIDWLEQAFGFERHAVHTGPDGRVHHAELSYAGNMIMLGEASSGSDGRLEEDFGPAWLYVVVDDPDAHHERAVAAGAQIVRAMADEDYGSRGYTARDPEGNVWSFGTYAPASS
jgi:uncharacterized glyoxalase superfamily protein PhnB